jgi:uncharacterized delta-60 repeat protein
MRKIGPLTAAAVISALMLATGLSAAPGDLDPSFDTDGKVLTDLFSGSNDVVGDVAVQPDGKVVVAGESGTSIDDSVALVRYQSNGTLDPAFNGTGKVTTDFAAQSNEWANAVAIQADGKIVASGLGFVQQSGTFADFGLVRYNPDGSLDATFGAGGKVLTDFRLGADVVSAVAVQPDGKIVAAGWSRPPVPSPDFDFAVARYNPDGSLDVSFDGDGKALTPIAADSRDFPSSMAVQPDGRIVVGGQSMAGQVISAALVRYLPNGVLDSSFDGDGKVVLTTPTDSINDLALQRDGKILTAGPPFLSVTRFNTDGSVDTTFGGDGNSGVRLIQGGQAYAIAVQRDGKIVAFGSAGYPDSTFALARFRPDGVVDDSFGSSGMVTTDMGGVGTSDYGVGLAVAPDGKLVAAGYSGPPGGRGPYDFAVARYLAVPPPCKVPNVRGKKLARAKASIRRARCAIGKVSRRSSGRAKKGRILSQRPKAGRVVPGGTRVNLVVSRGPSS